MLATTKSLTEAKYRILNQTRSQILDGSLIIDPEESGILQNLKKSTATETAKGVGVGALCPAIAFMNRSTMGRQSIFTKIVLIGAAPVIGGLIMRSRHEYHIENYLMYLKWKAIVYNDN